MAKRTLIADFTEGNIPRQLTIFAAPLFLSSLLQVVYNMVDMIVVGHVLGKEGLSGVSVGGDVSNLLTFLAMGFCNAGQVLIAQYIGAQKREQIGRFISTMFTTLMACAIAMSAICLCLREPILRLMNTPEAAWQEALSYSTICIIGLVFIYGYNIGSAVLRGLGDSRHPFIFIAIAAVLNIILDILFVAVLDMHAGGAALATIISQGVSFISCSAFIIRRRREIGLELKASDFLHPNREMLSALCKLGVPMAIKSAAIHVSKLFVNSWINSYGVAVSAFAGVANKFNSISNLISNSMNTSGSTMVGQNIAARKYHRVGKIVRTVFAITLSIAALLSLAVIFFPEQIFSIFTSDTEVLKISWDYIPVAVLIFFGSACRSGMNALINGSGNVKLNFVTAILDGIVMRIGLSVIFGLLLDMKHIGFWLGDACAGFTPFFIGIFFWFSGKWKRSNIQAEE